MKYLKVFIDGIVYESINDNIVACNQYIKIDDLHKICGADNIIRMFPDYCTDLPLWTVKGNVQRTDIVLSDNTLSVLDEVSKIHDVLPIDAMYNDEAFYQAKEYLDSHVPDSKDYLFEDKMKTGYALFSLLNKKMIHAFDLLCKEIPSGKVLILYTLETYDDKESTAMV